MRPRNAACARTLVLFAILGAARLAGAQTFTTVSVIHSFSGIDGRTPQAALIETTDGNLYGTTLLGGASDAGTVFRITRAGALTTLHSFFDSGLDGAPPYAGLIQASDGNFYGTAAHLGANGDGSVFRVTRTGALTTIHSFSSPLDGAEPVASLIQASDGSLYGTTPAGGGASFGTVFRITMAGVCTTLYSFNGPDGKFPQAALIQASDGNLYGTTEQGGSGTTDA